ncbi:hypothetical protein [Streptomyces narbonensis]|uniref:hypothetical protein n=1 Tax=Streptomyces narbonensis TaxID=67333 RepID=UPI0033EBD9AE
MTTWEEAAVLIKNELVKAGEDGATVAQLITAVDHALPAMDVRAIALVVGAKEQKVWTGWGLTQGPEGRHTIKYALTQEDGE